MYPFFYKKVVFSSFEQGVCKKQAPTKYPLFKKYKKQKFKKPITYNYMPLVPHLVV